MVRVCRSDLIWRGLGWGRLGHGHDYFSMRKLIDMADVDHVDQPTFGADARTVPHWKKSAITCLCAVIVSGRVGERSGGPQTL